MCLVFGFVAAIRAGSTLKFPDERDYDSIARNIADHGRFSFDGVHPTSLRPPGYPVFLGALRLARLGVVGERMGGAVLLAASIVLLHHVLCRVYGSSTAIAASWVTALYPLLLYTATRLYPQSLALLLLLLTLFAATTAIAAPTPAVRSAWSGFGGLAAGALLLTVPALGVVLVLAAILLLALEGRRWVHVLVPAAIAGLLLPSLWTVRNAVTMDAFVPISTNSGYNLLIGNSENATYSGGVATDISKYTQYAEAHEFNEVEANDYYQRSAVKWATHHPGRATVLYLQKVAYHFAYKNRLATSEESTGARGLVAAVTYLPFLLLFGVRLARAVSSRHRLSHAELIVVSLVLGNALIEALTTTRVRYRLPLDPLMIGVALSVFFAATARPAASGAEPTPRVG
jgi:4-amino-4-deoxy-L-arabinose transferase-like glycosyltransferase